MTIQTATTLSKTTEPFEGNGNSLKYIVPISQKDEQWLSKEEAERFEKERAELPAGKQMILSPNQAMYLAKQLGMIDYV